MVQLAMICERKSLFEAAKYLELEHGNINDSYHVGALVFLGREREAREAAKHLLAPSECLEAAFYLLLASLRSLNYEHILKDLAELLRYTQEHRSQSSRFYAHQALGLVRYYRGEFQKSLENTHSAFKIALELQADYFSMLACDLIGHAECMMENYAQGLRSFDDSIRFAKKIRNNSNISVLELSKMTSKISAGLELKNVRPQLESWIGSIAPQDYFTRTNALLLKAKLKLLEGDFRGAQDSLLEISAHVYRNNHGRQILEYNLLMAQLNFIANRAEQSLALIRTSLQLCHKGHDQYFLLRFKELELFALQRSNLDSAFLDDLKDEVQKLSRATGRNPRLKYPASFLPEAVIDHHLEPLAAGPLERSKKLHELEDKYLLGVSLLHYNDYRANFIEMRLPRRELLIYLHGKIQLVKGVTSRQYELIKLLITRLAWSKKDLMESHWQIPYDSFLHDNKVYITLKRLRNRLGESADFISLQQGRILIDEIHSYQDREIISSTESTTKLKTGLNLRQLTWLESTQVHDVITPREYARFFKISRNTCSRDLSSLEKKGHVQRIGVGPSCQYQRCN